MTEEFLHFVWKNKLFNTSDLITTSGEALKIIKSGEHNSNAGPDFFNSRINISGTVWAGNVEIHIKASDWHRHSHQHDPAYDNVILHVVYEADQDVKRKDGEVIPTLELRPLIKKEIFTNYLELKNAAETISCKKEIPAIDEFYLKTWQGRLMVERLEQKSSAIIAILERNKNNWEESFYQVLARNFGFKVNAEPFEMLARSLPVSVLAKYKDNLFQIEALLFGQAGFLADFFEEDYPRKLQNEYRYMQKKHGLVLLEKHVWKFLRLRPMNFPTVRLAQLAALIYKSSALFSKVINATHSKEIFEYFTIEASDFWNTHYTLFEKSPVRKKGFGKDSMENVVINTVVPFLFVYGKYKGDDNLIERAISYLEDLKKETNSVVRQWEEAGIKISSAFTSQAMIQLKNNYCNHQKCLSCSIGNKILSKI